MNRINRLRGRSTLLVGFALLCIPPSVQAQTAEEKVREHELQLRMEECLRAGLEERQKMEECLQTVQEESQRMEARLREAREERLARIEEAMALRQEVVSRERVARAEALARAEEARGQAREQLRQARQVVVRVRSRVRLGVSLDGNQGSEVDGQGAMVQSVIEGSPAQEAGLQEGDIITHLNGHPLLDAIPTEEEKELAEGESLPVQRLMALAQDLNAGDDVEIRYLRDGQAQTVSFEAAEIDDPSFTILRGDMGGLEGFFGVDPGEGVRWHFSLPDEQAFELDLKEMENLKELEELNLRFRDLDVVGPDIRLRALPEGRVRGFALGGADAPFVYSIMGRVAGFGLELTEMNPGLAEYFSSDKGLLVLEVDEESTLGLLPGDVILAIDGRAVESQGDVLRILGSYDDDETVSFTVVRKGAEIRVEGTVR